MDGRKMKMKTMKRILCLAIVLATLMAMVLLPVPASAATESETDMEIVGASIRISGTQGLRFIGRIKKSSYSLTYGNSANFGILLIPKYMVDSGTTITPSTTGVKAIPAKMAIEYNHPGLSEVGVTGESGYIYFVATLTGIPEEQYKTDFIAAVYCNAKYSVNKTRSVYQVADGITKLDSAPVDQKTACATIVTTANNYGTDIVVDVNNVN